jgi:hypothetical protein
MFCFVKLFNALSLDPARRTKNVRTVILLYALFCWVLVIELDVLCWTFYSREKNNCHFC